mmetsp:Transcript_41349/g.54382  ORF Transcript_41349/g.54382 Transcript_41349/m.54382 type:complete len:82 (+) Transcript_41349:137-382(+)
MLVVIFRPCFFLGASISTLLCLVLRRQWEFDLGITHEVILFEIDSGLLDDTSDFFTALDDANAELIVDFLDFGPKLARHLR